MASARALAVALLCLQAASCCIAAGQLTAAADFGGIDFIELALPFEFDFPGAGPLELAANFTIALPLGDNAPSNATGSKLPLLFLLPGFNIAPASYSRLMAGLAARGFTVVAGDVLLPIPGPLQGLVKGLPRPGCEPLYHMGYMPGLLTTFYENLDQLGLPLEDGADTSTVVLLGHSQGGNSGITALAGGCADQSTPLAALLCGGYRPINATIQGIITYEGFADPRMNVTLPESTYAMYLSGEYNNNTRLAFKNTRGDCVGYIQYSNMTHYGLTDYVADNPDGQVTPCALPSASDPPGWATTEARQDGNVDLVAETIAAAVGGDWSPGSPLGLLLQESAQVRDASLEGPCA